jgi:hypothetical protein
MQVLLEFYFGEMEMNTTLKQKALFGRKKYAGAIKKCLEIFKYRANDVNQMNRYQVLESNRKTLDNIICKCTRKFNLMVQTLLGNHIFKNTAMYLAIHLIRAINGKKLESHFTLQRKKN